MIELNAAIQTRLSMLKPYFICIPKGIVISFTISYSFNIGYKVSIQNTKYLPYSKPINCLFLFNVDSFAFKWCSNQKYSILALCSFVRLDCVNIDAVIGGFSKTQLKVGTGSPPCG